MIKKHDLKMLMIGFGIIFALFLWSYARADQYQLLDSTGHINGINYTTIEINGKSYDVPLANHDYIQDLFFLKKALKGDKDSLDMFLGGKSERWFPIGDIKPIWLHATKYKFEVQE